MHKLLFPLFSLSILFFIFSCKSPDKPDSAQDTFPGPGAQLTEKQAENLVFRWEENAQVKKSPLSKQTFRLYQLESVEEKNGKQFIRFKILQEEEIENKRSVSLKVKGQEQLKEQQVYAWEIIDQNRDPVKQLSPFGIGSEISFPISLLSSCMECYRLPGPLENCEEIVCEICREPNNNIHIVTMTDFGVIGGEQLKFTSGNVTTCNNKPCIREPGFNQIISKFSIAVPCDKLSIVESSKIRIYLYRGGDLLTFSEGYTLELLLNDTIIEPTEVLITEDNYLKYCEGESGNTLVCRANVEMILDIFDFNESDIYTIVFFLPANEEHTHGLVSVPAINQQQSRTQKTQPIIHSHAFPNSNCLEQFPDTLSLSYFECINADTSHISQHVVVFPLEICPVESECN